MTRLTPLLLLGLLLGLQAVAAVDIAAVYGFCPKYIIKSGDTIFELAKDLNVTQEALMAAATDCGADLSLLQIDEEICLPGYDLDICERVLQTDPDRPYCQVYEVQEGDTTKSVAKLFGISEQQLIDLNSDYLDDGWTLPYAGQYVRIPGWDQVQCRDFNDNEAPMCQLYVVQAGDSATDIAKKFKVSLSEMLELNGLDAEAILQPNFRLKLPKWNESCPPEGIPAVLPSDTVSCRVTQLRDGESLALLATRYLTSVQALQQSNPALMNVTLLQPGTFVNLPPFPISCVGQGNLVDVPGQTTVPASYDYNGLAAPTKPSPPAAAPSPSAAAPAPAAEPDMAPVSAPAPTDTVPSPSPTPAPATPAPPPIPTTSSVPPAATASLFAALFALLAGIALL